MEDIARPVEDSIATVEILSDPELVTQIRQGEREIEAGEGISLEELEAQISSDIERAGINRLEGVQKAPFTPVSSTGQALSLSKALLSPLPSWERARVRVDASTGQIYRQPQSLPWRGERFREGFPQLLESLSKGETPFTVRQACPEPVEGLTTNGLGRSAGTPRESTSRRRSCRIDSAVRRPPSRPQA